MAVGKVPWLGSLPAFGASNEEYWLGCANALVPSGQRGCEHRQQGDANG